MSSNVKNEDVVALAQDIASGALAPGDVLHRALDVFGQDGIDFIVENQDTLLILLSALILHEDFEVSNEALLEALNPLGDVTAFGTTPAHNASSFYVPPTPPLLHIPPRKPSWQDTPPGYYVRAPLPEGFVIPPAPPLNISNTYTAPPVSNKPETAPPGNATTSDNLNVLPGNASTSDDLNGLPGNASSSDDLNGIPGNASASGLGEESGSLQTPNSSDGMPSFYEWFNKPENIARVTVQMSAVAFPYLLLYPSLISSASFAVEELYGVTLEEQLQTLRMWTYVWTQCVTSWKPWGPIQLPRRATCTFSRAAAR